MLKEVSKTEVIENIKKLWKQLKSRKDLASLLSYAHQVLTHDKNGIKLNTITFNLNPDINKKRYETFTIPKKSGGERTIHAPRKGLKMILRALNFVFQCIAEPHEAAFGFVPQKSIFLNAQKHIQKNYVMNLDLKDFFYSFDRNRVKLALMYEPFYLPEPLAFEIASLCTHPFEIDGEIHYVLPQGAPTSPTLTNILCRRLDKRLNGLAKRFDAVYTRYADDLTFSCHKNIFYREKNPIPNSKGFYDNFWAELERLLDQENLKINHAKVRLQKKEFRQEVTGLTVNQKVNVKRKYIKQIRVYLHLWEKQGYEKAQAIFQKHYSQDPSKRNKKVELKKVLDGKLNYLKMIKSETDSTYQKLWKRYNDLFTIDPNELTISLPDFNPIKTAKDLSINDTLLKSEYPHFHNTQKTSELLKNFTRNDEALKYTTHSWDYGNFQSYDEFIKKVKKEWKIIEKDLKFQSEALHQKIYNFLLNKNLGKKKKGKKMPEGWGEKNYQFGWSSPYLKEWMEQNPKISPFKCPIPNEIQIKDKFSTFEEYVKVFKDEIEFRDDSENFKTMILELYKEILGKNFRIFGINELNGFSLFTDVLAVKKAIQRVFEIIKNYKEFPNIHLKINKLNNEKKLIFQIIQENSVCNKNIHDEKIQNPSGDLKEIIKTLRNVADFSIIATFKDGFTYQVNYLSSIINTDFIQIKSEPALGFTYQFTFYL